jgi:hypothetical protein
MTNLLQLIDRIALTLLQVAVLAGLPLAAVGLMTNSL